MVRHSRSGDGDWQADEAGCGLSGSGLTGVEVLTFGCRLNIYESEVMKAEAAKPG